MNREFDSHSFRHYSVLLCVRLFDSAGKTTSIAFTSRSAAALRENGLASHRPPTPSSTNTRGSTIAAVYSDANRSVIYKFAMDARDPTSRVPSCVVPMVDVGQLGAEHVVEGFAVPASWSRRWSST